MRHAHFHVRAPGERPAPWERAWVLALLVLASALPLLWPDVPPLVDLPGHMGRYRVQLELASNPILQQYYSFDWALIGNLGVDLLVELLAPLVGLEPAVKMIVIAIPPLTVVGMLWVAYEVHGRIPPTTFFALPFAYSYPFLFGFANFALAMALALNAFAFWLRLARLGHSRLRPLVFIPLSVVLWVAHAFGWGTLGVLAFSAELVRQFDGGRNLIASGFRAGLHCIALTPPLVLMLLWRSEAAGTTGDWFNWKRKYDWLRMVLRDRWEVFDIASLLIVTAVIVSALVSRRISYSRNLFASMLFLALVFVLLPRIVFGSAYADMRLAPFLFAIALIAIRYPERSAVRYAPAIAIAGLAFFAIRTAGTTTSMVLHDRAYDRELAALPHIPYGARLVSMVGRECLQNWNGARMEHLPALALVRRRAFSNDQWTMAGAQLLGVRYSEGRPFMRDPSQMVVTRRCRRERWLPVDAALARLPRHAFDYLWLITPPSYDPRLTAGMRPIWTNGRSTLFRIQDRMATSDTPAGSGTRPTR